MNRWRILRVVAAVVGALGLPARASASSAGPSVVTINPVSAQHWTYSTNGQEQLFVGMGYNPIYRNLSADQRSANYRRDFRILCQAGVNTITGWDADKGYQQDTFDELTLDSASQYGIGVVMPMYIPPRADYTSPDVIGGLFQRAIAKVQRFRNNPALRMWGVGNEVLTVMPPEAYASFFQVYLNIIDLIHEMDPNHPVIYREAEDGFAPTIAQLLRDSGDPRPWLLYGMNVYDKDPGPLLEQWPSWGLGRPLIVTEFGWAGTAESSRAQGYSAMWRSIRAHGEYVLGGAAYAWTSAGPEPTDVTWGLMNSLSVPVDDTFAQLARLWQGEPLANHTRCV